MVEQQSGQEEQGQPETESGREGFLQHERRSEVVSSGHSFSEELRELYLLPFRRSSINVWRIFLSAYNPGSSYVGVDEVQQRLEKVEEHQRRLDTLMIHGVQPAIQQFARMIEGAAERDVLPAASSAQYEWHNRVTITLTTIVDMIKVFDDMSQRLSVHVTLQGQMADLLKLARLMSNPVLVSATLTLHDALYGIYSEDLTLSQAQLLKASVEMLRGVDWDIKDVRALDRTLRKAGFETIPSDKFRVSGYARNVS